jgi:hypothetical protein
MGGNVNLWDAIDSNWVNDLMYESSLIEDIFIASQWIECAWDQMRLLERDCCDGMDKENG